MRTPQGWLLCWILIACVYAPHLPAQTTKGQAQQCLRINVRLNGKPIDGPEFITLKTRQTEVTPSMKAGCFNVPPTISAEKAVDVAFRVPGNKISLWAIPTGFLSGSWDIELADKKFGSNVVLPEHARAKQACAVVFHVGEPETAIVQTGCRTPLRGAATKTNPPGR